MRALALFSGGLDSILSVKLLLNQGIEVIALHFDIGFGGRDFEAKKAYLERVSDQIGARLEIIDIKEDFIQNILFSPKYGYGKNMNPCIDCHANMFKVALSLLERYDAKFVISGEVMGQRPMSQRSEALKQVSTLSGNSKDLIVRPLSAKNLEPTFPEKEGWIDREQLLGIYGRGREVQMRLAKEFGIEEYESPAGGCLLTDQNFSQKIRDFRAFDTFEVEDIEVLKWGRHFRLPEGAKLVVARNQEENEKIKAINNPKFTLLRLPITGPLSLFSHDISQNDLRLGVAIALTYGKSDANAFYDVEVLGQNLHLQPLASKEEARKYSF